MCDSVNQITQAVPQPLTSIGSPVYSTSTPTVFGVQYTNITATDPKSYSLKVGEEVFKRGFGVDTSPVQGQYGGYIFIGNSQTRTFGYNVAVNTSAVHAAIVYKAMRDEALYRTVTAKANLKVTCTDAPLPLTDASKIVFTTIVAFSTSMFVVLAFAFFTASIVPYLVNEKHPSHNSKHQQLVSGLNALSMASLYMAQGLISKDTSAFSTDILGWEIVYLAIEAVVFPLIAIGIDYALSFPKIKAKVTKDPNVVDALFEVDEDVQREELRIASGAADKDAVVMKNIRKVYKGGKVGVANLSLALPKGECFGHLGINGAGETTTMKIMTGDDLPTSGSATLGGFDIITQQLEVRRLIGYCPQFDALIDLMTVREHLELFAAIKGVPSGQIGATVKDKMEQMNLNDFEHKLAGTLSGGNKRKLSVAIAMIGSPPIIVLDEPSTGMDPVSRRFMWDVIADISTRSKESTILLTTHSMEECEALCTRVGIMVGGRLRCVGSIQHLKHRFGDGLMMHVRVAHVTSAEVERFSREAFASETIIAKERVAEVCSILGKPHRANFITSSHATGYVLAESLTRHNHIRAHEFYAWWLCEDRFDAMSEYLHQTFGDSNVQVLERQNDVTRFKLLGAKRTLALSNVFSVIERAKSNLCIEEYTVSQTTLEQIFNSFAAQQTQETGVARGMQGAIKGERNDNYESLRQ
ncbi:unnamed protein product [Aphanomyces euteiches]